MRRPTPTEVNNFVARLEKQDRNRLMAFSTGLSDAERQMTVDDFLKSKNGEDDDPCNPKDVIL